MAAAAEREGKRVSFVELYLDLIFVLAVGRVAYLLVEEPRARSALIALGLFVTLWWTWIGFVVLYNRYGQDDTRQRLAFLAATIPGGVAAIAVIPAAHGQSAELAAALAALRLVLAGGHLIDRPSARDLLRDRTTLTYLMTGALFAISLAVPTPWRYVLWGFALSFEAGTILDDARRGPGAGRQERRGRTNGHDGREERSRGPRPTRAERRHERQAARDARQRDRPASREDLAAYAPANPGEALDAGHFAERFGLFLIILLGEVMVEAGAGTLLVKDLHTGQWLALAVAMVLAGALWWLYFDGIATVSEEILRLSGGSPVIARAIYAGGHMMPAYALLLVASGVGLLVEGEPPAGAYWLASIGLGLYLFGTRVFLKSTARLGTALRTLALVATFLLGLLHDHLDAHAYLALLAAWAVACAAISTRPNLDEWGAPTEAGTELRV